MVKKEKRCEAVIQFEDLFQDNPCTFHCELPIGHEGKHKESGDILTVNKIQSYILVWEDEYRKE